MTSTLRWSRQAALIATVISMLAVLVTLSRSQHAPNLIRATVDDISVANLVIEQATDRAQVGAVEHTIFSWLRLADP